MRFFPIPRPVKLLAILVILDLVLFSLLRAAFYLYFHVPADRIATADLLNSFYIGMKFDLRLALIMNIPVLVLALIPWTNVFTTKKGKKVAVGYLVFINTTVVLTYVFDFGHYAYLQSRLNVTAFRFLYNLGTSAQMIWETYPVVWGLIGLVIFALMVWYVANLAIFFVSLGVSGPKMPKMRMIIAGVVTFLLIGGGIYGKFSYYPLRWSDAYFSTNEFASAVALNPVMYFLDTIKKKRIPFSEEKTREAYPLMADYLGIDKPDIEDLNYVRKRGSNSEKARRPNIIIVLLESFAFYKTGVFGNPLDPTPHFDTIAKKGALFTRFYVPSSGTARSVFALITGLPDVDTHRTSSRNPLIVSQHTIINEFRGYEKYYFLGGSLNWANIRGLLAHNIPGLNIYEEGSYPSSPRVDVWGIPDLHLFEEANRVLRERNEPFFAIIQTSGNHRPYTIPEDNRGFRVVDADEREVKEAGFISVDEFNSFRFMDHSIGNFMETASKEKYFNNTIFVFLGDHGLPGNATHMRRAEEQLRLTRYHVPLVIYAPGTMKEGRVYGSIASEVDVLPTLAGYTSIPYLNTTLGRDLFDARYDGKRYAFTISDQNSVPELGLVSRDFIFVMYGDGTQKRLHSYSSPTPRDDVSGQYPKVAEEMEELCRAIWETVRYMPYHNAPDRFKKKVRD